MMRRLYSDFWDEKNFFFEKKFFLTFSEIFLTIFQQNFFQRLLFSFGQWSKIVMNQFPFFWCYSRVSMCHNWAVIGRNQKYFRRPWAKITKFRVSRTIYFLYLFGRFADCTNKMSCFLLMFWTDIFSTFRASVPSTHFFTFSQVKNFYEIF